MKLIDYILVSLVVLITMIIYDNMKNSGKIPIENFSNDEKAGILNAANILQNINAGQSITLNNLTITGQLKGDLNVEGNITANGTTGISVPKGGVSVGNGVIANNIDARFNLRVATNKFTVNKDGNVEATGSGQFGNAWVGSRNANYAFFTHKNLKNKTDVSQTGGYDINADGEWGHIMHKNSVTINKADIRGDVVARGSGKFSSLNVNGTSSLGTVNVTGLLKISKYAGEGKQRLGIHDDGTLARIGKW
jgi:hypothetical protein